jgi:hypothetical protein
MNNGVLTTSDFIKKEQIEKDKNNKPRAIPKGVTLEYYYLFPPAPKGKSRTTIQFEDKPLKIEMTDGIYSPPKNWNRAKQEKFHAIITKIYKFEDKSRVTGNPEKKEKKEKEYVYRIGHPENTPMEKVNGNVSIKVGQKEYQFECKNGVVETESKRIYNSFIKKGWYEMTKQEKKNE